MSVLNIGAGFAAHHAQEGINIEDFCAHIRGAGDALLRDWHRIAEPDRYLPLIPPTATSITTVAENPQRNDCT